jgi:hypothetical protein
LLVHRRSNAPRPSQRATEKSEQSQPVLQQETSWRQKKRMETTSRPADHPEEAEENAEALKEKARSKLRRSMMASPRDPGVDADRDVESDDEEEHILCEAAAVVALVSPCSEAAA